MELFNRDGNHRALRLTPAGECVLRFADDLAVLSKRLRRDIGQAPNPTQLGAITLITTPFNASYIISGLLTQYYQRYPYAKVNLVLQQSFEKINVLARTRLAVFGLLADQVVDKRLRFVLLMTDRLVLVAAPNHPASSDAVQWLRSVPLCPFASAPPGSFVWDVTERWAASLRLRLDVLLESWNFDALKEFVVCGAGLSIMPETAAINEIREGQLKVVSVPGLPEEYRYCLVFNDETAQQPAARALLDLAHDWVWRTQLPPIAAP